jgi:GNAT superfamily N-acetyltransferase
MSFAIRHRNDPMPALTPLDGLTVRQETTPEVLAQLQGRGVEDIARRFADGHRAYVARMHGMPAAFGWVATRVAEIGEMATSFTIPDGGRYLWNFVTLPSHRGLGIYPRLLQAILRMESREAETFWIAYAPENRASGSGITKAGFTPIAEMSFDAHGRPALRAMSPGGGAAASRVLGLRETSAPLTPCWKCVRAGRPGMSCTPETCRCDYQNPRSDCAIGSTAR